MHQRRVIAALEINLRLLFDAVVDNGIPPRPPAVATSETQLQDWRGSA
jgi:hypothetical protein